MLEKDSWSAIGRIHSRLRNSHSSCALLFLSSFEIILMASHVISVEWSATREQHASNKINLSDAQEAAFQRDYVHGDRLVSPSNQLMKEFSSIKLNDKWMTSQDNWGFLIIIIILVIIFIIIIIFTPEEGTWFLRFLKCSERIVIINIFLSVINYNSNNNNNIVSILLLLLAIHVAPLSNAKTPTDGPPKLSHSLWSISRKSVHWNRGSLYW